MMSGVECPWCGDYHKGRCTLVKAIEYYESGGIKRVEFELPQHVHEAPMQLGERRVGALRVRGVEFVDVG